MGSSRKRFRKKNPKSEKTNCSCGRRYYRKDAMETHQKHWHQIQ